jgi:hypothetical protein
MNSRLDDLLREIRELEASVQEEMKRKEAQLQYEIRRRKVIFEKEVAELHRRLSVSWVRYVAGAPVFTLLTAPVIYAMLVPALLLDATLWLYQAICLSVYGIPKVRRADYVILDRHHLKYLNAVERLNCDYCSYFNGLVAYAAEIAARTEQYWCPIKHARGRHTRNSRTHLFTDYGDAEAYRARLEAIRRAFDDVDEASGGRGGAPGARP